MRITYTSNSSPGNCAITTLARSLVAGTLISFSGDGRSVGQGKPGDANGANTGVAEGCAGLDAAVDDEGDAANSAEVAVSDGAKLDGEE